MISKKGVENLIIKSKEALINIIESDIDMMKILKTVALLDLPNWWISAGFIRNKIGMFFMTMI